MRVRVLTFLVAVAILCGCASDRSRSGHGDAGQFILQQAISRGGKPVTTNNLPAINARWRYSTDEHGVVVRLPHGEFSSVETFLLVAFGKPQFGPTDTIDGGRIGGYKLTEKGGGIQFVSHATYTEVIVLRPLGKEEWADAIPKAFKAMGDPK